VKKFVVYILRTAKNTLYTGQTNNLERRLKEHSGKIRGARYVRNSGSFELVYVEKWKTRSEAMKREAEIKRMPKIKKEKLVLSGRSGDGS
jgi:putative endonuclease